MKKILLIYLLIFQGLGSLFSQTCLPDTIVFSTQGQIDSFAINYPGCSEIMGAIKIRDGGAGTITNLDGLNQITSIGGFLKIEYNSNLENLTGLASLDSIGGRFGITGNDSISNLTGLDSLCFIGGSFQIFYNKSLVNLNGLESLNALDDGFLISNNESLIDLSGLDHLTSVGEYLYIDDNASLIDLSGLENLTSVGYRFRVKGHNSLESISALGLLSSVGNDIVIQNNPKLESLSGLESLDTLEKGICIENNDLLTNLSGLNNLSCVQGSISISFNDSLASISELSSLATINGLEIAVNPSLTSLAGLENITSIGSLRIVITPIQNLSELSSITSLVGSLEISDLGSTFNLTGLENITSIGGKLKIAQISSLQNLSGLSSLTAIGGLELEFNNNLTSLTGLENINSIGGNLIIFPNYDLASLTGLENVTSIEGKLELYFNNSLNNFSELESLTSIGGDLRIINSALSNFVGLDNVTSIGGNIEIIDDFWLESLSGLESLTEFEGSITVQNNPSLLNVSGLENLDLSNTTSITIENNDTLSLCGQGNICNYIITGGDIIVSDNAPGCNDINEIIAVCFQDTVHTNLIGQVIADMDQNCEESNGEEGIPNWLVHVSNDDYSYGVTADSFGNYWLPVLEGDYDLNVISPSSFWNSCFSDSLIEASGSGDTILIDFFMQPLGDCAFIDWDVSIPQLRICASNTFVINYCNYGAFPAEDVIISISLDSFLNLQNASIPYTVDGEGSFIFEFDSLAVFECGQFTINAFVDCDSVMLWDVQCIHVDVLSEELCSPDSLWDGSTITVNGFCENDSIYFELENIGTGNMAQPAQFRVEIVIDDIVLLLDADDYQLDAQATQILSYEIQGLGMRIEADQTPGHPVIDEASAIVPNCEDIANNIILNLLFANDGDPYSGSFCGPVVGSFDPNSKDVLPIGLGLDHEIDKDWELDYTINFQNTGNAEALLVVLRDTLSDKLDLATLKIRGATHPFEWELNPGRELVFTFNNIMLPDSTSNEPESHGFVQFSISPKMDLLPGDSIENEARIYFDSNDPILTNTVFHTIKKPVVATIEHLEWCEGETFMGLEIWQDTTFQILTPFPAFDSIHFIHLDLNPLVSDSTSLGVTIGEYFNDVLILGDTLITYQFSQMNGCDSLVTYTIFGMTNVSDDFDSFEKVTIIPNPVSNILLVSGNQNGEVQKWRLNNNLGQAVWERQLDVNEALPDISMTHLPTGVYWLNVSTNTSSAVWKMIKL